MKLFKRRTKAKISLVIFFIIGMIFFFTFSFLKIFNDKVNDKVVEVAEIKLQKFTESFLSNNIGFNILNESILKDILEVNKNSDGEILYVNYNLNNAYLALDIITSRLNSLITDLESGEYKDIKDNNIICGKNGLFLKIPMFVASDNAFLASLGPDIYMKVNFVGSILTNIKSKITDYGLNNALVELYVTIKITEEVISPVTKNTQVIEYDVLIASQVINGRVPLAYGGAIYTESNLLSIPIE